MRIPFRLNHRNFEWQLTEDAIRSLTIRSCDGRFEVRAKISDDAFMAINGRISASLVHAPIVIGCEFPPGCPVENAPFQLDWRGFEIAKYGIIHTEFVRSLVGRWSYRRRYQPLDT